MALTPGTRLGPYEIVEPIGVGGMGEVYRARDARLDRTVAIKVLLGRLAADPERRQRFEREARAVSSLNHPHICTLHDIGHQDGIDFLVMEHLEGETLSARLAKGPLPSEQVFRCAIEIGEALIDAHRKGVFHRDLKPGNVMLTRAGVKLLDFGLAKLREPRPAAASLSTVDAELTVKGTILGTLHYMAPEQIEGKDTDARADIFSFGALLYEMAAGRKAFEGQSAASVMSAILHQQPPPIASPALDRVAQRCLAKDPEERWQTATDLTSELKWISQQSAAGSAAAAGPRRRAWAPWAVTAVATLAALVLGALYLWRGPQQTRTIRAFIPPPDKTSFDSVGPLAGPVAISPDGRRLVFAAFAPNGRRQLWVRSLDALQSQALAGTDGGAFPFWSPDGRFIAFFAAGKLKKIPASGGPAQTLCDVEEGRGGAWNRDGVILFSPSINTPIFRVSDSGGAPAAVTQLHGEQTAHRWPSFLPDGRHFLYLGMRPGGVETETTGIYLSSLESPQSTLLVRANSNATYASGHLLYSREGSLLAQPFDARAGRVRGDAFPIAEGIQLWRAGGRATFSVSDNGVLVYPGGGRTGTRLLWFDRGGKPAGSLGQQGDHSSLSLSNDGRRLAVDATDADGGPPQIWLYELARELPTRLTMGSFVNLNPVWSADGGSVAYTSIRKGQFDLYRKAVSGAGGEEMLRESGQQKFPSSWSLDGRFLAYATLDAKRNSDLWVLPLFGDKKPFPFLDTEYEERSARFSPNGRWIAYSSNESGTTEVYIAAFRAAPGRAAGKLRVSPSGGSDPKWRRDGKELFYLADNKIVAAELRETAAGIEIGQVRELFAAPVVWMSREASIYDVSPDGQRFIVNSIGEQSSAPLHLVLNWNAELHKLGEPRP